MRVVQLAARQNQADSTKILTGIKEGERVATSNLADLYDGAVIQVASRRRASSADRQPGDRSQESATTEERHAEAR